MDGSIQGAIMTNGLVKVKCDLGCYHWVKPSELRDPYRQNIHLYKENGEALVWSDKLLIAGQPVTILRKHIVEEVQS